MGASEVFWLAFKRKDYDVLSIFELEAALNAEKREEAQNPFYLSPHVDTLRSLIAGRMLTPSRLDRATINLGAGA